VIAIFANNTKNFIIREFTSEDLDTVIWINRTVLPENYPSFFFKMHHERYPKAFLVAVINDKIVGYVMCRVEKGRLYIKKDEEGLLGHVISLAVINEVRRQGIGKSLMINAMNNLYKYYNVDEYYLEVRISNNPAIALYKKLGFQIIKTIKGYYLDGEDAYVMARTAPYLETEDN